MDALTQLLLILCLIHAIRMQPPAVRVSMHVSGAGEQSGAHASTYQLNM